MNETRRGVQLSLRPSESVRPGHPIFGAHPLHPDKDVTSVLQFHAGDRASSARRSERLTMVRVAGAVDIASGVASNLRTRAPRSVAAARFHFREGPNCVATRTWSTSCARQGFTSALVRTALIRSRQIPSLARIRRAPASAKQQIRSPGRKMPSPSRRSTTSRMNLRPAQSTFRLNTSGYTKPPAEQQFPWPPVRRRTALRNAATQINKRPKSNWSDAGRRPGKVNNAPT